MLCLRVWPFHWGSQIACIYVAFLLPVRKSAEVNFVAPFRRSSTLIVQYSDPFTRHTYRTMTVILLIKWGWIFPSLYLAFAISSMTNWLTPLFVSDSEWFIFHYILPVLTYYHVHIKLHLKTLCWYSAIHAGGLCYPWVPQFIRRKCSTTPFLICHERKTADYKYSIVWNRFKVWTAPRYTALHLDPPERQLSRTMGPPRDNQYSRLRALQCIVVVFNIWIYWKGHIR